jgi:hypothetical protein
MGQDELCLMTRLVENSLEFRFLYLPQSTSAVDFTVFHWTKSVDVGWKQVKEAAEAHKRDLSIFDSSPFEVFGITSPNIQSRIISGNSAALVTSILHCDPKTGMSTMDQYRIYLHCEPNDPAWIVESMMADQIPHYYSQHVSESSVYWMDNRTGTSTWAHPFYLKYTNMLKKARKSRPRNDSKHIAMFQLSCLFDTLQPPLLSIENVIECSRIFQVRLREEPFLIETLKGALRFLSHSLTIEGISDFIATIERKRREFKEIAAQVAARSEEDRGIVNCVECEKERASIHCSNCDDLFCFSCFKLIHSSGARQSSHVHSIVEIQPCDECQDTSAAFHCTSCLDAFCSKCFATLHGRGGRRNHVPVILRRRIIRENPKKLEFEIAKSSWVKLEYDIPLYLNLETMETRRDVPLTVINSF